MIWHQSCSISIAKINSFLLKADRSAPPSRLSLLIRTRFRPLALETNLKKRLGVRRINLTCSGENTVVLLSLEFKFDIINFAGKVVEPANRNYNMRQITFKFQEAVKWRSFYCLF